MKIFYKNTVFIVMILLLSSCTNNSMLNNKSHITLVNAYSNKGFALVYSDNLYIEKIISKKIDERSLIIFQKNLKTNTQVKITNILNKKSIIAVVGKSSTYPSFNNSVLSSRIAVELDLDKNQPYVEILEILGDSVFVAKKAKTFDEEKKVAEKAPVTNISINDLNEIKKNNKKNNNENFFYTIKVADFYFNKTALLMVNRIRTESSIKNPKVRKLHDKKYRVYLGPFDNINSLQNSYNDISILKFENIEIIKND